MYIFDSREKKNEHIKAYFDRHEIAYRIEKLEAGDYMIDGGKVTVDRKGSVEEISGNLTNPTDKQRFMREVRRSRQLGLRLVVLVETNKYKAVKDLAAWKSKYTPVRGTVLIREMERLRYAYGVEFRFCPKMSAARKIVEILEGKQSENL
jgi:hypothetical protein